VQLSPNLVVHAVPTEHWSARGIRDRRHALWASFVLEGPAGTIYIVGDTGFGDGATFRAVAKRHPRIRLSLLPIGAYEPRWFMQAQHMNPTDAVAAFSLLGTAEALGHHWGTFQLTTERHDRPPADLAIALAEKGVTAERFRPVRPGEVWTG
jgi:L-ascorbate metabolism protein UlaG (beta-lactamase superfamily)